MEKKSFSPIQNYTRGRISIEQCFIMGLIYSKTCVMWTSLVLSEIVQYKELFIKEEVKQI